MTMSPRLTSSSSQRGVAFAVLALIAACGTRPGTGDTTASKTTEGVPAKAPRQESCPSGTNAECTTPDTCDAATKTCFTASTTEQAGATTPSIASNLPLDAASGVAINTEVRATFSEGMDPTTLTTSTFTLTEGSATTPVSGTVTYGHGTATFFPAAHLASGATFVAKITTAAKSAAGVAIASEHVWTFTTGTTLALGNPVNLGTAGSFAILAKSGISTVPSSIITGDIGVSPIDATAITGFSLSPADSSGYSSSDQVTGKVYAADYASPTPAMMTTAIGDMELAFTSAAARAPDVTELGSGDISGQTLAPGVYKWGTGLLMTSDVTLSGSATDVWIFQIAQDLTVGSGTRITLAGNALPKNVFWQVSGLVDLDTTAHLEGIVLAKTSITFHTGATINGRLLAQTAVNLDHGTVTQPAP